MKVCEELGGLPLALDQAGAYIEETQCCLSDYLSLYRPRRAEMLKERGYLVDGGPKRDYPETVATIWSISFAFHHHAIICLQKQSRWYHEK